MTEPQLSPDTVLVAARDQVSTELEGEAVILDLADGVYYGLDGVGRHLWELLAAPRSVRELYDVVVAGYEVAPAEAERDVAALLSELLERGLVEIVS